MDIVTVFFKDERPKQVYTEVDIVTYGFANLVISGKGLQIINIQSDLIRQVMIV